MLLPWLELTGLAKGSAKPPLRTGFFYLQNGVVPDAWHPETEGPNFELTPTLEPLSPVRSEVTVVSGLDRVFGGGTDVHAQCGSCWLTSSPADVKVAGMLPIDTTIDQVIAKQYREETIFPSLELTCNSFEGDKEAKYFRTVSWYGPGSSATPENNPRTVYRRLFGIDRADPIERSILDVVSDDAKSLRRRLGALDRLKVEEYFESVRSIERRMDQLEKRAREQKDIPMSAPAGMPNERSAYIRMMGDLVAIAFQLDLTRVVTMILGPERWNSPQHYDGVFEKPVVHHPLTHAMDRDEEALRKVKAIDRFRVAQFSYIVEKFRSMPEGEGTLLDHSALILGAGLGNGNRHNYDQLPVVMAGRGHGAIAPGRFIRAAEGTPLANLWLSLLDMHGAAGPRFADSTGKLSLS